MSVTERIYPTQLEQLWAALLANGRPPTNVKTAAGVLHSYTSCIGQWLDRLSTRYLGSRGLCRSGSHCKVVLAPNGGGKTHFLQALGARALKDGFAVSYVSCENERGFLARSLDVYSSLIQNLQLSGYDEPGILSLLESIKQSKREEIRRNNVSDVDGAFRYWISRLPRDFPRGSFGRVLSKLLYEEEWGTDQDVIEASLLWLRGEIDSLNAADRDRLRVARVPAANRARLGRELMWSAVKFLPNAGVAGLVLLLDEAESQFGHGRAAMLRVLAAMRVMVDVVDVPLFTVFAATPGIVDEFHRSPPVDQRLMEVFPSFDQGNDFSPRLKLDLNQVCLLEIGKKLIALGGKVTGHRFDFDLQTGNLQRGVEAASAFHIGINVRSFVRNWANLLQHQANQGERLYSQDEIKRRYQGDFRDVDGEGFEP